MQQLQKASDPLACAAEVLEAVFEVILRVREQTARGQAHPRSATLIHLRAMGTLRRRPGLTLSALADQLALTLSATSRLVECLVAKGFVTRRIPAGNRRTVSLQLTPAGTRFHARALDEAQRGLALTLQRLAPAQRAVLHRSMRALQQALADASDHPAQAEPCGRGGHGPGATRARLQR